MSARQLILVGARSCSVCQVSTWRDGTILLPPSDPGWLLSPRGSPACSRVERLHEAWGTQNVLSLSGQALLPPKAPFRNPLNHVLPSVSSGRTQRASPTDGMQEEATNAQAFLAADGQGGGEWAQPILFSLHTVPFALGC